MQTGTNTNTPIGDVVDAHAMRLNRTGTLLSNHVRSKGEIAVTCFDLQGVRQSQTAIGGLYNHSFIIPFS